MCHVWVSMKRPMLVKRPMFMSRSSMNVTHCVHNPMAGGRIRAPRHDSGRSLNTLVKFVEVKVADVNKVADVKWADALPARG